MIARIIKEINLVIATGRGNRWHSAMTAILPRSVFRQKVGRTVWKWQRGARKIPSPPRHNAIEAVAELERAAGEAVFSEESQFGVRAFRPIKDVLWYSALSVAQHTLKKIRSPYQLTIVHHNAWIQSIPPHVTMRPCLKENVL